MLRRLRSLDPTIRDTAGAALLLAAAFVPGIAELGLVLGDLYLRPLDSLGLALVPIQAGSLVLRRRWPAACLAIAGIAFGIFQVRGYPANVVCFALVIALYSVGAHQARHRRAVGAVTVAGYVALAVELHRHGAAERVIDYVTFAGVLALAWGAGAWVRARQRAEARKRQESVGEAITAERSRIARELHDVVTHHVTAMVVQADAAGFLITADPERAAGGITAVGRSGREALTELRRLLGVLESGEAALEPAAGRLGELVDRIRAAGQPVEFAEEGGPAPGGGLGLAVYRVVQEGLTNAVKHARGRPTRVRVRHAADGTAIEVVTAGPIRGAVVPGRGLTGLRERVKIFGGTFEAGGAPGGDFTVRAHLPAVTGEVT